MTEIALQKKVIAYCKQQGWCVHKVVSQSSNGFSDLVIVRDLPAPRLVNHAVYFLELKRSATAHRRWEQEDFGKQLLELNANFSFQHDLEKIKTFLK